MRKKVMKKIIASVLAVSLIIPAISYLGTIPETKAADNVSTGTTIQIGDTNEDGKIDAMELVRIKKGTLPINKAASIDIDALGSNPVSFITKDKYSGGSMISFDAYVPAVKGNNDYPGISWFAVNWTTDATSGGIYAHTEGKGSSRSVSADNMGWQHFDVPIATADGNSYYIYIVGAVTEWGTNLIIDNVKITTDSTTVTDNFDNGFESGLFNVDSSNGAAVSLYTDPESEELTEDADLDGSGVADDTDADLMRQFLVNKIYSFYKADTSSVNNDTSKYQVTDELDREITDKNAQEGKQVGIRYFLHFGTEATNKLYSVSDILKNNKKAYDSSEAWTAAGGGAVGTKHWWGKSLFGYYTSMDKWVVERDVQMLTDAGIDFLAIDTTDGVYTEQLKVLLEVLNKYYNQGFNVPKVTFTSAVTSAVSELQNTYSHLWYTADTIGAIANMSTVHVAESMGEAMSSGAFYGDKTNHSRSYNGKKIIGEDGAVLQGYHFEYEFEEALANGADVILVENWNEWLAERATGTDAEPIVLNENADMENSSDIQPMDGGYGDDYYMQLVDCIKEFKGNPITNSKLNTATVTESVNIDITGDLKQWNKVSTHYLDYTDEINDRDAEGYDASKIGYEVVVNADNLATSGKPSLVTKKAYPVGSKVSFDVYAEKRTGDSWWVLRWTSDKNNANGWSDGFKELVGWNGGDSSIEDLTAGHWEHFEYTLTGTESEYYLYFFANVGAWSGKTFTIDNFVIETPTDIYIDTFDEGIDQGLFEINDSAVSATNEKVENHAASIDVDNANENADFITKQSYPAGSKVSFKIYVPEYGVATENQGWWALCSTDSLTNTTIWGNFRKYVDSLNAKVGKWDECEITLDAAHGENQYLYFCGSKGTWNGYPFYIDDFTITDENGTILVSDDFNNGLENIFNITSTTGVVTSVDVPTTYTDATGRNDISKMKVTSDGENLYALVETVDAIKGFGKANCMSLFISTGNVGGCWNQYEYVVNRDSSEANDGKVTIEKYVAGAWKKVGSAAYYIAGNVMQLAIPLETIGCSKGCNLEFKWADNYSEDDIYSFYTKGDVAPYGRVNYVYRYEMVDRYVAISAGKMNTEVSGSERMNFITSEKYPAGSTVTFKAYYPTMDQKSNGKYPWWSIQFTTDNTNAGFFYDTNQDGLVRYEEGTNMGKWATYSVPFPSTGSEYYIYIGGARDEWGDNKLLIDDFTITKPDGTEIKETFNNGYGIFDVKETAWDNQVAVELKEKEVTEASNQSAKLDFTNFDSANGAWDFITTDSYPKDARIVFDAYIPNGTSGSWWRTLTPADPSTTNFYDCSDHVGRSPEPVDEWFPITVEIKEGNKFFAIGGPVDEWKDRNLFVDNFRIYNAEGELIAKDDFSDGLHGGIFDVDEISDRTGGIAVSLGTPEEVNTPEVTYENGAMELAFSEKTSHVSYMSYPAGSTVTFDAYVTASNENIWWGVDSIQDRTNDNDVYLGGPYGSDTFVWNPNPYYCNDWATYEWKIDSTGFIAFEGSDFNELIIDNIVITSPEGVVLATEDFDDITLEDSMFEVLLNDKVSLVEVASDETDILFTAYDSPTINGSTSGDNYAVIDEAYGKIAEAGFNKLLPIHEGYTTVAEAQEKSAELLEQVRWRSDVLENAIMTSLDLAQKHGLKYYVKDWSFYNLGKSVSQDANNNDVWDAATYHSTNNSTTNLLAVNTEAQFNSIITDMFKGENQYVSHPAYAGSYAMDEPFDEPAKMTTDFNALTWQAKYYNQAMQKLIDAGEIKKAGEFYVNLKGANYEHIDDRSSIAGWFEDSDIYSNTRYAKYVNKYVTFAKDQGIDYISWDMYPFMEVGHANKETVETNYLYNFKIMADNARDNNLSLRYTLQSSSQTSHGYRAVTDADLRFQIYTGMAFGVNDFTYFKYSASDDEGNAIFDRMTGETNETLYNYAKTVNHEVHAIEDWFADYKWSDIMVKQGSEKSTSDMSDNMIDGMKLSNSDSISHDKISSVTATQDTIAGIFKAKDSTAETRRYAYMFVNLADPTERKKDTVTINFADGVKGVCVCVNGKQEMVAVSGSYTFTLEPGAGAFIVPIQ